MVHCEAILELTEYFRKAPVISEFNNMKLDPESSNKTHFKTTIPLEMSTSIRFEAITYPSLCEENRCFYVGTNTKHQYIFIQYNFLNSFYPISQFCQIFETELKLSCWPSF